jgi:hypothetical protein
MKLLGPLVAPLGTSLLLYVVLPWAASGCGAAAPLASSPARSSSSSSSCPETRALAPGVELRISCDASPGAREAADRLQAEYRSTYLDAR